MEDTDQDGLNDGYERDIGIHDRNNKPLHKIPHINVGGNLPKGRNGIIAIHHDNLDHIASRKMSLSLDIKTPKLRGYDVKKAKMPDLKIDDDSIRETISRLSGKKKRRLI